MTYQRPQFQTLANRLVEPRRFIQVVAGQWGRSDSRLKKITQFTNSNELMYDA